MKVATINYCSSNPNLTHLSREVTKPLLVMVPQIKQCHMAITNNLHYAIKSESFKFQMKERPIDGQHMGVLECTAWNY
jgi:hypothetical protein